jgi:hypothetical integral membrane protein (TIGR02206 family)
VLSHFFAKNYTGAPFELFGAAHLVALAIVLLVNLAWFGLRSRLDDTARRRIRTGLAWLLLVNEAAWHLWHLGVGTWTLQTMLPLHLCSALVFVSAAMLLTRNETLYQWCCFLGIGGAIQPLLTPDIGIYGFPHFRFFQSMISHGCIVTAAIYMTVVEGHRPQLRTILHIVIGLNLYMFVVGGVNAILGSNYLFIAHKPDAQTLLNVMGPWPWYILSMEAVGLIVFLLLYLPFGLRPSRQSGAAS